MADPTGLPPGELLFRWGALVDKFHLTPAQIAELTDFQISRLFFHKRGRDGGLVAPPSPGPKPDGPPTAEGRLRTIDQLEHDRLITPQKAAELREQVKRGQGKETEGTKEAQETQGGQEKQGREGR